MWSSRIFLRILLVYGGMSLLVAIGCLIAVTRWQRNLVMNQVQRRLQDTAIVYRSLVADDLQTARAERFQALTQRLGAQTGTRLTLIRADGTVLADSASHPQLMNNHLDREEIQQALREGLGEASRESATLGIDMFYVALPVTKGERTPLAFVRVAMSMESINDEVRSLQQYLLLIVLFAGVVVLLLTYAIAGGIIRPLQMLTRSAQAIAAGQYGQPIKIRTGDEFGMLGDAFEKMRQQLNTQVMELSQQAKRQATVFRSMLDGVIVVNSDNRITLANQAAIRLLNFNTHTPEGKRLDSVIACQPAIEAVSLALDGRETLSTEAEIKGNETRIVALQATRLPGEPCPGVVAVVRDVTELRHLENMRRDFAANVSHELKTPLTSIKAYAETLRLGALYDDENNLGFLVRIEEQAERLHQLILDLLQLSRIESGEEMLEIRNVSLSEVIVQSVSSREDAAAIKNITLSLASPPKPLSVHADEEGVRTVLDNLIDNAIKYTPDEGNVTVRWSQEGEMVLIEVEDTGIGIAQEEQGRIFERFYRVDKARSRELGGTGLGLSIVKHMTQSLGGSVGLRSQLGRGSTFQIRLPLATPPAPGNQPPSSEPANDRRAANPTKPG